MDIKILNFVSTREKVRNFLKNDKKAGIKKAWYFQHLSLNQTQAIDKRKDFIDFIDLYKKQNINLYKEIIVDKYPTKMAGAKYVKLYVFRSDDDQKILQRGSNQNGEYVFDEVAVAFDYLPAECETCIAEVIY